MALLFGSIITVLLVMYVLSERRAKKYQKELSSLRQEQQLELDRLNENVNQLYHILKSQHPAFRIHPN